MTANRPCRYATKRRYKTRAAAVEGAELIKAEVRAAGRVYDPLFPYRCPDGPKHWHLSHMHQSKQTCPECGKRTGAWKSDSAHGWVIAPHECQRTRY